MLTLEKGSKKYHCPNCSKKTFVIYVNEDTGQPIADYVGRCDRESSCCYHFKPKDYFEQNPNERKTYKLTIKPNIKPKKIKQFYTVELERMFSTLSNYDQNNFVQFLLSKFDIEPIQKALAKYFVGTFENGKVIFWQVDRFGKVRTGKIINYDRKTGKRQKETFINEDGETVEIPANWIHKKWFREWELETCIFGEHLIKDSKKPLAIVEAEKTAIIASILNPEYTWLAIGGMSYLTIERLKKLDGNSVVLYPDAEKVAYQLWKKRAIEARQIGLDVSCSDLIEKNATDEQKAGQYDLADFLLESLERPKANVEETLTQTINKFHKKGVQFEVGLNDIYITNISILSESDRQFFKDNTFEILYLFQFNLIKQRLPKSEFEQFDYEINERISLDGDTLSLLQITRPIFRDLMK